MSVNWSILSQQSDPGTSFQQGYQNALLQRQQQEDRQFRQDQILQQRDMQREQMNVAGRERKLTDYHDSIRRGARIIRDLQQQTGRPLDEAGWQNVRAAALQAGIDLTDVPEHFDPNYVQQLMAADRALQPQGDPYTLSEGDVRFGANNEVVARGAPPRQRYYSVPPGGRLVPEPQNGGPSAPLPVPPVGAVEGGYRFKGGDPANPQNWEPVGAAPTSADEAPAFHPAPGGAAFAPRNFP